MLICIYDLNVIDINPCYDRSYGGGRSSETVAVNPVVVSTYVNAKSGLYKDLCNVKIDKMGYLGSIDILGGWYRLYSLIRHVKLQSANLSQFIK